MPTRLLTTSLALVLAAAALRSQVQWSELYPGSPGLRYRHAMAFDSVRGRTVLFSGAPNPSPNTWEWDGSLWREMRPAMTPGGNVEQVMAFDTARSVTVMWTRDLTTGQAQTWEWDGTNWSLRTSTGPTWRHRSAMTYDAARGVCVLFGGSNLFNALDEIWEWNGAFWTQRNPANRPPAREMHAMTYDAARGVTVMFGGQIGAQLLNDTWLWDGVNWTQLQPQTSPSRRSRHRMVFDSARGVVVSYGGYAGIGNILADTWEWNGVDWTQRAPMTNPPQINEYGMAYDSLRGVTVMHGGSFGTGRRFETWEWDGNDWTPREPGPLPRAGFGMDFDAVRGRVVLFGGGGDGDRLNDTWEWNGASWSRATPAVSPPAREQHAMAWFPTTSTMVMVGGLGAGGTMVDTWEWNGTTWTNRPVPGPSARWRHAMAADPVRGRLVLFGGLGGPVGASLGDTWEWDGNTWTQLSPPTSPPPRHWHSMAYDPRLGRVVLFGGEQCQGAPFQNCGPLGDAWSWNGTTWIQLPTPPTLTPRIAPAMALDLARAKLVLHGGRRQAGLQNVLLDEVWEWDGAAWTQTSAFAGPAARAGHGLAFDGVGNRMLVFGGFIGSTRGSDTWGYTLPCDTFRPGHPGGGLTIGCTSVPRIGSRFCVTFSDPPPLGSGLKVMILGAGPCNGAPLPLGPPQLCSPGSLWATPSLALFSVAEPANFCLTVPMSPGLLGTALCAQGASLRSTCFRAADALALTLVE